MITVYGIANCDTVKKARVWLAAQNHPFLFHDFRKDGIDAAMLDRWLLIAGWETLLNRNGTTFRQLDDDQKQGLDTAKAAALMLAQPAMIKRPVVEYHGGLLVGFRPDDWLTQLT